jgi:serine phosphatase RsbU (regulator of sigma subunit)
MPRADLAVETVRTEAGQDRLAAAPCALTHLSTTRTVLLISDQSLVPRPLGGLIEDLGYLLKVETDPRALFQFPDIRRIDLVLILVRPDDPMAWSILQLVSETIAATHLPLVAIGDGLGAQDRIRAFQLGAIECLCLEQPLEELKVRLRLLTSTKERFDTIIDQNVKAILLARKLRQNADRLDEELRLARRLQMDFLPRKMPEIGRARFAARLYPAGWVAGDFYDVFHLDERHVGFYIADAIGHGVPAALLTIFVKHSLQTKRIGRQSYELIPPDEALALLNADLLSADLHLSPFISMLYAIMDVETGELTYARAGHPRPLLLHGQQPPQELPGDGPLLGIMANAAFERARSRLAAGDRLLFYTDGVERCRNETDVGIPVFCELAARANTTDLEVYLQSLLDVVLKPRHGDPIYDDVTLVAMDLLA